MAVPESRAGGGATAGVAAGERVGPRAGDAFGAALLACWEAGAAPGSVFEYIERDDGFLDGMDAAGYFAGPEQWEWHDQWARDQALARGGRALDVGAGAGRFALCLQERGLDVVALDVSAGCIEVCRQRGIRHTFAGTVPEMAAAAAEPFGTFLLQGNNLGLLGGAEEAPRFLAALAVLARPGAAILGRGMDPYQTANPLHLAYHERNRRLGRLGGQIRMRVRWQDLATPWFDYLFATVDELRALLVGTAWHLEHVERQPDGGSGYEALIRYAGGSA